MEPESQHTTVQTTKNDYSQLYIPAAIIIAGALIAGGLYFGSLHAANANAGGQQVADGPVDASKLTTDNMPIVGNPSAPLTIYYWYDYQCPFCKAVEVGHPQIPTPPSFPEILAQYVDTGKAKIVYKDYPFLGDDSMIAAQYKHAVWELYPAKFLEWHHAMMEKQDEEHGGFGNEQTIVALTKTIAGIDANAVKAKVASDGARYTDMIAKARDEGAAAGVSGTPGFVIGEKRIDGAVPFSEFKKVIDPQL